MNISTKENTFSLLFINLSEETSYVIEDKVILSKMNSVSNTMGTLWCSSQREEVLLLWSVKSTTTFPKIVMLCEMKVETKHVDLQKSETIKPYLIKMTAYIILNLMPANMFEESWDVMFITVSISTSIYTHLKFF